MSRFPPRLTHCPYFTEAEAEARRGCSFAAAGKWAAMAPRFSFGVLFPSVLSLLSVMVVTWASVKGVCDRVGAGISANPLGPSEFSSPEVRRRMGLHPFWRFGCVLQGLCAGDCTQYGKTWGPGGMGVSDMLAAMA